MFEPDIDFSTLPAGLFSSNFPVVSTPTSTPSPVAAPAPSITEVASGGYADLGAAISDYRNSLFSGADYFDIDDVDRVDDYYNATFKTTLGTIGNVYSPFDLIGGEGTMSGAGAPSDSIQVDPTFYFANVDAPDYLKDFKSPATTETAVSAYSNIGDLENSSDMASALSNYYGYEITPTEQDLGRFGGKLEKYTGASGEKLAEFHSLVEPILAEQVSYLQTVEGFNYQDALQEAYKRDPMLQALYYKYDVTPIRYDSRGSEYIYDPFSYGEIRTIKVDKPNLFEQIAKAFPTIVLSAALGPAAGSVLASTGIAAAGTTANAVLSSALASAASAGLQGADLEEALKAALISGGTTLAGDFVAGAAGGSATDTIIDSSGNITFSGGSPSGVLSGATDLISPVFNPDVINLAASAITAPEQEEEEVTVSDPLITLDDVLEAIENGEEPPTTTVDVPELADIPVTSEVEPIEPPEEFEEDIAPPVVVQPEETVDTGGGGGEAPAPDTVFTQEDIDSQIAEAVANATEGLFTSDQVDQATQEAIDSLPEDTTEFSQDDLDKAVSDALADAKIDSDAALAGAYEVFQENLPEDTTEFSQDDVDRFIREALEAIPEDVTPFNQEDIDTAVQDAINALPEDVTEFNQEDVDSAVKEALAELQADFTEERTGFESTIEALESDVEQTEEELAGATQEIIDLTNLISNLETTSSDLRTTLESAQEDLAEEREVSTAQQEDIDTLNTSVSDLTTTVENLQTSLQEANDAREAAVEQGNQALADALEQYQELLQDQITTSEQILENAIAAGETALSDAVAAGNAAVAEAVATGEALGEARYGEGLGTGRGEGAGAGIGAGLGLGLLAGMAGGMGGGTAYTPPDFEDYQFRKTYQAPELLELAPQYAGYQAPTLEGLFRGFI